MNILWITNILFPDVCREKNIPVPVGGAWMYSSIQTLMSEASDISLAVATVHNDKKFEKYVINKITYYLLPLNGGNITRYTKSLEVHWKQVKNDFNPDIAHLHGTEYAHGNAFIKACPEVKAILSLQGLVSVIDRYYLGSMSFLDVARNITFRDLLKSTLWTQKKDFTRRGYNEREMIRLVKHIIGRTTWDRAHTYAINPQAKYHFCNETLREIFYQHTWDYSKCEKHSIFLSQASYPIKGLHKVIEAMPYILRHYPDSKIYVGGINIVQRSTFIQRLKFGGYGKYIYNLIHKHHLENKVIFLGLLNEQQICDRYLKSNVFLCPSSIENSPNSLGEAQLLGVPCIASYVGGVMDMMKGAEEWMYRFEEVEMLAYKICEIFNGAEYPLDAMRNKALIRHSRISNVNSLVSIYQTILKSE